MPWSAGPWEATPIRTGLGGTYGTAPVVIILFWLALFEDGQALHMLLAHLRGHADSENVRLKEGRNMLEVDLEVLAQINVIVEPVDSLASELRVRFHVADLFHVRKANEPFGTAGFIWQLGEPIPVVLVLKCCFVPDVAVDIVTNLTRKTECFVHELLLWPGVTVSFCISRWSPGSLAASAVLIQ